jgi:hypothetical protein
MIFWLILLVYVVFIIVFVKQSGFSKFPLFYGDGRRREQQATGQDTRRIASADHDPYSDLTLCPPEGPLVFVPQFKSSPIGPGELRYFQTRLKLPRDALYSLDFSISFQTTTSGAGSAVSAVVGLYLGHLEYFNEQLDSGVFSAGPFLVEATPNEVVTVSVRNRQEPDTEALRIETCSLGFTPRT